MVEVRHRLFVALWPDTAVRNRLWELARSQVPGRARLTHRDDLHLTLWFLGPVAEHRLDPLQAALEGVTGSSFDLRLTHTGHWPRPQICWCAPDEVPTALGQLLKRLQRALEPIDFAPESRPYRPHVTLARKVRRATAQALPEPICWRVDRFALVSSTQVSDPPRYRVLRTWPLGN